ncbi:Transposon protein [Arachis hypogaea]|nr:Transposon protein [Arachis hypogaea]
MSNPSVTEIYIGTIEQEGKEATHTHQEQPQRATLGAKKQEELTAILHCAYDNLMVEMEELKAKRKGTCSLSHEDANLESVNELQSPPRVRTRGQPKNRLGSKLDK